MELTNRNSKSTLASIFVLMIMVPYAGLAQTGLSHDGAVNGESNASTANAPDKSPTFIDGNSVQIGMAGRHHVRLEGGQTAEFIPGDLLQVQWDEESPLSNSHVLLELERKGASRTIRGGYAPGPLSAARAYRFDVAQLEHNVPYMVKHLIFHYGNMQQIVKLPSVELKFTANELTSYAGYTPWRNYPLKKIIAASRGSNPKGGPPGDARALAKIRRDGYSELKFRTAQANPKDASAIVNGEVDGLEKPPVFSKTEEAPFDVIRIITINPKLEKFRIYSGAVDKLFRSTLHGLETEKTGELLLDGSNLARVKPVGEETEEQSAEVRRRNLRALSELRSRFPAEPDARSSKGSRTVTLDEVKGHLVKMITQDPSARNRRALIDHIAIFGDNTARRALIDRAQRDPDDLVRMTALAVLFDSGQLDRRAILIRGASVPKWNIFDPEILDLSLATMLHDMNLSFRRMALFYIRSLADFRPRKGAPKDLESKATAMVNTVLSRTADLKDDALALESSINEMRKALKERKGRIVFERLASFY